MPASNERAFLVGLYYHAKRPRTGKPQSVPQMARDSSAARPVEATASEFTARESLAAIHEPATSAAAHGVGEVIQSRERLDPATLIGRGKLEEIGGGGGPGRRDLGIFYSVHSPHHHRH